MSAPPPPTAVARSHDPLHDPLRAGARLLTDDACRRIADGIAATRVPDAGFRGRGGSSDLYYTPFALYGLQALGRAVPSAEALERYLASFGDGAMLDAVHRAALALSCRLMGARETAGRMAAGLRVDRMDVYGRFLAALARHAEGSPECTDLLSGLPAPVTTPQYAAAVALAVWSGAAIPADWIAALQRAADPAGGLRAGTGAPMPDLLSTGAGLFAWSLLAPVGSCAEATSHVAFVTRCWRTTGRFASAPDDPDAQGDSEYTFHALLALGALAG